MGKDLKLDVEGTTIWWLDNNGGDTELKEIKIDMDALAMVLAVKSSGREVFIIFRAAGDHGGHTSTNNNVMNEEPTDGDEEEVEEEDSDLEGRIVGQGEGNEDDSDLCDSSYKFSDDSEEEPVDERKIPTCSVTIHLEPSREACEGDYHSDYAGSKELNSASSTDENDLIPSRPKYSEINEAVDMHNSF